ncbi:uncharacterized protein LOC112088524 [Eutrema salsugineum]|uniref:uncharacterized protein LOC112088524 n=1 Tax=Eutrema salsugineum TaxID=72664 RepID=UPI000CECEBDC|nr:uncharacterized protein LOC112088524 [Eutrema salsugineum]
MNNTVFNTLRSIIICTVHQKQVLVTINFSLEQLERVLDTRSNLVKFYIGQKTEEGNNCCKNRLQDDHIFLSYYVCLLLGTMQLMALILSQARQALLTQRIASALQAAMTTFLLVSSSHPLSTERYASQSPYQSP